MNERDVLVVDDVPMPDYRGMHVCNNTYAGAPTKSGLDGCDKPEGHDGDCGPLKSAPTPPIVSVADNVEYDLKMPGGGTETIQAGNLEGMPDPELLARRRLMQLKMVTTLLGRQKRRAKLDEAKPNRVKKSRKKRDAQKASRKKNRK